MKLILRDDEVHQGDIGTQFLITLKTSKAVNATAVDISDATNKQFIFKRPGGTIVTVSGTFYTDGTDGKLYYTNGSSDSLWSAASSVGMWEVQIRVTAGASVYTSERGQFRVYSDVDD